ncbi:Cof-type HAD-IIB family hydrolase [Anaerofustis butyriciformans]|uniref:Cof-type HAD-IIB family hydrolase n=1 Tax=Anaerofustis TaxID=264995 RepID=UPI003F89BAEE
MKYKLIVMDVDNTLLCTDKSVSKKNLEAIKKCMDKGVMVSLASGRPALDVLYYAKQIGIEDNYHVSDNGAGIFRGNDRKIIKEFNRDFYIDLIDKLKSNNIECGVFSSENFDFVYEEGDDIIAKGIKIYFPVTKSRIGNIRDIKGVYKVSTYFHNDEEYEFVKGLEKEGEMQGVVPDPNFFDMMPYNVTKIEGTRAIAEKLGISMDEVIVMGDQGNDYTNVKYAGLGVAVANATDDLKEVADVVLEQSCDEDAVAYVIDKYILGE